MHFGKFESIAIQSGADLTSHQYRVVTAAGVLATEADTAMGVNMSKVDASGKNIQVGYQGNMKGIAGATISAGNAVTVASGGFLIAASSGSGACGKAVVAAASGDQFNFIGNFAVAQTNFDGQ